MIFRFDRYTLNSGTRTLSRQDTVVTLTPKVFQTLLILVENHHRVMSKAELFEQLWPKQTVEEANLTQNISILRKALEEAIHGKRYIATFHGHGYRFVEPVVIEKNEHPLPPGEAAPLPEPAPVPASEGESPAAEPFPPAIADPARDPGAYRGRSLLLGTCVLLGMAVLVLLCLLARRSPEPLAAQVPDITTLTRMEGTQYQPSWSADGKNLTFIDAVLDSRTSSIDIQVAGEVSPRQVVTVDGAISSPVWSPDGKSLAFIQTRQGTAEIRILSLQDGTSRRLTTLFPHRYGLDYRHMDWSPDGNLLVVDDKLSETDPLSLYLVHVSDGSKLRLTYPDMDIIGDVAPRFSPDGSRVAFVRVRYQYQDGAFVVPVAGGEARALTDEAHRLGDVDWQTNDSVIFSGRLDSQFRFWRCDLLSDKAAATLALPLGTDLPSQFSIARRTGRLAFSAYAPDLDIWSLDLTRTSSPSTAWKPIIRTPGQDLEPAVSPDGSKMAFRSDLTGHLQLWVSLRNGTGARQIDTNGLTPSVYCWTRDSNALIFSSRFVPGLFEARLSGAPALKHITSLPLTHPTCSLDGKSVFAVENNFVYRLSLADGTVRKISDNGGAPIAQSEDGRYLYFAHGRMESTISRLDLNTGRQSVIIESLAPGYSESWALASNGIFFLRADAGGATIMFHDLSTDRELPVIAWTGNLPPVGLSQFSISPDEKTLFVVRADPVSANIESAKLNVQP